MNSKIFLFTLFYILIFFGCDNPEDLNQLKDKETIYPSKRSSTDSLDFFNNIFEEKASKEWKIAYISKGEASAGEYLNESTKALKEAAATYNIKIDYDLFELDRAKTYNAITQLEIIDAVVDSDYDGLIIYPINQDILENSIQSFRAKKKPVVVIGAQANSSNFYTKILLDNYTAGLEIGKLIAAKFNKGGKVIIFDANEHNSASVDRRNGFIDGLSNSHIEVLTLRSSNGQRELSKQNMDDCFNKFSKIDAVLAVDDFTMLGITDSIKNNQKKGIIVAGIGGTNEVLEKILKNEIHATINLDVKSQIKMAVQLMIRKLENTSFDKKIFTWQITQIIDKNNVSEFLE